MQGLPAGPEARQEHAGQVGVPAHLAHGESVKEPGDLKQGQKGDDDGKQQHQHQGAGVEQHRLHVDGGDVGGPADLHHQLQQGVFQKRRGQHGEHGAEQDEDRHFLEVLPEQDPDVFQKVAELPVKPDRPLPEGREPLPPVGGSFFLCGMLLGHGPSLLRGLVRRGLR